MQVREKILNNIPLEGGGFEQAISDPVSLLKAQSSPWFSQILQLGSLQVNTRPSIGDQNCESSNCRGTETLELINLQPTGFSCS